MHANALVQRALHAEEFAKLVGIFHGGSFGLRVSGFERKVLRALSRDGALRRPAPRTSGASVRSD